MRTPEFVS